MNRFFLYCSLASCLLRAVEIPQGDIPLEIDGGNVYKFYNGAIPHAVLRVPISVNNEIGDFKVIVGALSGTFSSGTDKISYAATKNPLLDTIHHWFPMSFTKSHSVKEIPFIIRLSGEKILTPGTYTTEIPITILQDKEIVLEKTITAHFYVEEQLEARIFFDGEMREEEDILVAFGEINGRAEKELMLSIRANTDIRISISSQNKGRLILMGDEDKISPNYIPYVLQNQGEEISLVTKTTLFTEKFTPGIGEIKSKIKLLLNPDVKKHFSGKYKDRLCITISST